MNEQNFAALDQYFTIRDELAALVRENRAIAALLDMTELVTLLDQLEANLNAENFKVMILGEFKTGKSTFINALLRQRVLPAFAIPCTAIINEVKWGDAPRAVLHRLSADGTPSTPLPVAIEDLEQYVVIGEQDDVEEALDENPYERAEIFFPLELCRSGVEIIDSPGLNENPKRQAITLNYLPKVDAVVFVCSSTRIGPSMSEKSMIDDLHAYGYEDIFFVCNQIDRVDAPERDGVKRFARAKLSPYSLPHGERRVFFISAKQALDGQMDESGLPVLESELHRFLTEHKGKLRFKRVVKKLREAAVQTRAALDSRRDTLKSRQAAFNTHIIDAHESLVEVEAERARIEALVESACADLRDHVRLEATAFLDSVAQRIPDWITEYKLTRTLSWNDLLRIRKVIEDIGSEIAEHLTGHVDAAAAAWRGGTLEPLLQRRFEALGTALASETGLFVGRLDEITGVKSAANVDGLGRVLLAGQPAGDALAYEALVAQIVPPLTADLMQKALAGFQPWNMVSAWLSGGALGVVSGVKDIKTILPQIKQSIGEAMVRQMEKVKTERTADVASTTYAATEPIRAAVGAGLKAESEAFRARLRSMRAAGADRDEEALLDSIGHRLETFTSALYDFVDHHLVIVGD